MKAIQISQKSLYARWAWTTGAAILTLLVLRLIETTLKAKTGIGTVDLQLADNGPQVRFLLDRWQDPRDASLAGFSLGLDFLFIPLYTAALYFGSLLARDRFAPQPGFLRRLLNALSLTPLIAGICDVGENTLELAMLTGGVNDTLAAFAYDATSMKYAGLTLAVLANLAALFGLVRRTR